MGLPLPRSVTAGYRCYRAAMQIPDSYRKQIEPLIAHARELLEKGETLAPLAFVGNLAKNDVIPVVIDDRTEEAKDQSAHTIHLTATVMEADFIFMLREAWKLPKKYMPRHEEIMAEYGSIGASPYAEDVAAFSLETTHGTWIASPFIKPKPPSKKRRTFGAVVFEHMPEIQGRFTGLLPGKKNDGGHLH